MTTINSAVDATSAVTITQQIDREQLEQAAWVFYEAFRLKLDHLEMRARSPEQTIRIMTAGFRPKMGFFALRGREVVGLAGMQNHDREFLDISYDTWRREFGLFGGLSRYAMRRLTHWFTPVPRDAVRVQGIAVAAAARGLGVGTLLMNRIEAHARESGLSAVILEVVDTNPDAQRLYERLGFIATGTEHYGRFTAAGGFSGMTKMRKELI